MEKRRTLKLLKFNTAGLFAYLPTEILKIIAYFLTARSLANLCQINKWGNQFFSQDRFWKPYCEQENILAENNYRDYYIKNKNPKPMCFLMIQTTDQRYAPQEYLQNLVKRHAFNRLFIQAIYDKNRVKIYPDYKAIKKNKILNSCGCDYIYTIQGLSKEQVIERIKNGNSLSIMSHITEAFSKNGMQP